MGLVGRGNSIHLDVGSMQSMCAALVRRAEHCPVSIGFLQTGVHFRRPTHVPGSTTHNFAYKPPPDKKSIAAVRRGCACDKENCRYHDDPFTLMISFMLLCPNTNIYIIYMLHIHVDMHIYIYLDVCICVHDDIHHDTNDDRHDDTRNEIQLRVTGKP